VREVNSYDSSHSGTSLSAIALIEVNQSLSLADDGAFRRPFIKRSIPPFAALRSHQKIKRPVRGEFCACRIRRRIPLLIVQLHSEGFRRCALHKPQRTASRRARIAAPRNHRAGQLAQALRSPSLQRRASRRRSSRTSN
jgi:hypothetical protein